MSTPDSSTCMFPGEPFLRVELPDYDQERLRVTALLIVAGIFWMIVFPGLWSTKIRTSSSRSGSANHETSRTKKVVSRRVVAVHPGTTTESTATATTTTETKTTGNPTSTPRKKTRNAQAAAANEPRPSSNGIQQSSSSKQQHPPPYEPPSIAVAAYSIVGLAATAFYILMTVSSYNAYTARRVFSAPLLTLEETEHIQEMAAAAAQRNFQSALQQQQRQAAAALPEADDDDNNQSTRWDETTISSLLQEPTGWQKTRHGSYPTTDLNLITDPFLPQDRAWLGRVLDQRLAPTLARVYGIPVQSIRANDLFIVRYDANLRAHLANHTDDSDVSFVCLLNDGFTGGGTRFWDRLQQTPFAHVQPQVPGECSLHSALIHHEGYHVSAGTRMILVGFLSIDRVDPFSGQATGLPVLASWGSWSWLQVKFKQALLVRQGRLAKRYQENSPKNNATSRQQRQQENAHTTGQDWAEFNRYMRHLFADMVNVLQYTGDNFATHAVEDLVAKDQRDAFLQALDDDEDNNDMEHRPRRATWWQGQQIDIGLDGKVTREWSTRKENAEAFDDL